MSRARVRVTREQCAVLVETLSNERHRTVILRAWHRDAGHDLSEINRRIDMIDQMQDEVRRTADEMGWEQ